MTAVSIFNSALFYSLKFLEKPREEFSGHPTCPFISKELRDKSMLIDKFDPKNEDFLDKMKEFDMIAIGGGSGGISSSQGDGSGSSTIRRTGDR